MSSLDDEADAAPASKKTATAEANDDLAMEFAALEEKGELTLPPEKKKKNKKKRDKKKKKREEKNAKEKQGDEAAKAGDETSQSKGKRIALAAAKTAWWLVPALIFWWVLGFYLARWVSAGWLIGAVSTMFVFGMPAVLRKVARRGSYRIWAFGLSLVASVALIAPMPTTAGQHMAEYGHWPSTMVAEVTGAQTDAAFVRSHAAAAGWIGETVATAQDPDWEAHQLGTEFPLGTEWSPEDLVE